MKWDDLPQRFFSNRFLETLYQYYDVESTIQESLRERLENSARDWYYSRTIDYSDTSPREVRQSLEKISNQANALSELLKNAPNAVWSALVEANNSVNPSSDNLEFYFTSRLSPKNGLIGKEAVSVETDDNNSHFETIYKSAITEALGEMAFTADFATQIIASVKKGPQPDKPLQKWIVDMRNIWYRPLDRPFTVHEDKGEPISQAAEFCVQIYAHLAPETPKSRVMHEMKKRIAEDKALLIKFPHWKN